MQPLTSLLFVAALSAPLVAQTADGERVPVPGQLVVCFHSEDTQFDLASRVESWNLTAAVPGVRIDGVQSLLQWRRRGESAITNVVLLDYSPARVPHEALMSGLSGIAGIRWSSPNNEVLGEQRELIPNDPSYGQQYHHPLMQNDLAWNITLGDPNVVIGITDDGVWRPHVDLAPNIFVNTGEIAGNGVDDDGNGYIDDLNGWDFSSNDSNPDPENGNDHGTHCAGIAAGRTNNGIGIAGTAGGCTIMPLRFYGSGSWTAAVIASSFRYGVDNGARILSTSYNMDGWVGDPVVNAAFDYLYDNGALHFNSAGNNNSLNPPRQAFEQSFLVASTDSGDVRSSFSNYGNGIDVAAPGSSVYSTVLSNGYGTKSGTSMASPNAAGAAALIWSAHPSWTRDQVAAALYFSADNIDAQNPTLVGLLGGGRVNPFKGITMTLPAPKLVSSVGLPAEGATIIGAFASVELRFDQVLDPLDVNAPGAFTLTYAGADGVFGTGDDAPIALGWSEYLVGSNRIAIDSIGAITASGVYRFSANAAVLSNPFGAPIDGNGDGVGGDSWTRTFNVCAVNEVLVDNAESGVGWSVVNTNLTDGPWTQNPEVPIGGGVRNDPPTDYDGSGKCFLTDNAPGNSDVDGGPTQLISRVFDLSTTTDPYLSFAFWFVTDGADVMTVDVSNNNGTSWSNVVVLTGRSGWELYTFRVADVLPPTAQTRLRFSITDAPPGSITEGGIDYLRVLQPACGNLPIGSSYCVGAVNSTGSGAVIRAVGSDEVSANDFTLVCENLPANRPGLFYFGSAQTQAPFGNGFRCVSGSIVRLAPVLLSSAQGVATSSLDLTLPPMSIFATPGAVQNFQYWYRDPDAIGATFNLSNGLSVTWQ